MKKFFALFVTAALLAASLTACGNSGQTEDQGNGSSSSTTPGEPENNGDQGGDTSDVGDNGGNEDNADNEEGVTQNIVDAIKGAYDPDTLPFIDMLPEELISDLYGLDPSTYTEVTANVPMISTYVDTVIVVKAASGKAGDVEAALNAYHDKLVNESIQYPINVEKVNAAKVVTNGDYVAFIMLGAIDEREDASDGERADFAQEQIQIGVDAFNAYFN